MSTQRTSAAPYAPVFLALLCATTLLLPPARAAEPPSRARFANGQLIVKFRTDLQECAHCLLAKGRRFSSALAGGAASVDALNQRAGVRAARSLFVRRHGQSTAQAQAAQRRRQERAQQRMAGARRPAAVPDLPDLTNVYLLEVSPDADVEALVRLYRQDPHVEYAQPNYLMVPSAVPNDPYYLSANSWGQGYDDLWGLKKIQAEQAWDLTQGQGAVVAVVDTGLDLTHPDILANVWTNPGEIPGNGLDDDSNGYVDDVYGWDFSTCQVFGLGGCYIAKPEDNDPTDRVGHGTHVAGTIAAVGNNGIGIIGVAPQAKIMAVKGFNDGGQGQASDLANAVVYAAENGAAVINNSWGCGLPCETNPVAEDAMRAAHALGATVVFSAGNSAMDTSLTSPQNMQSPKPVVVGATTQSDALAFFSNTGFLVDVAAPGAGDNVAPPSFDPFRAILSLRAALGGPAMDAGGQLRVGGDYLRQAGTSMAAPHVSGLAALILAHHPAFSNEDVRLALRAGADDLGTPGADAVFGGGRIQAARALAISTVPQSRLTSPVHPAAMSAQDGAVAVVGTAAGPAFSQYALSYSPQTTPGVRVPIGGAVTTPVANGALGTWDVHALETDLYLLRLVTTSTEGFQFEDVTRVAIENLVTPIAAQPNAQAAPNISGDRMVWTDERHGNPDVYLYDYATQVERQITTHAAIQRLPAIDGDRIVWLDDRNGFGELRWHDLATGAEQVIPTDPIYVESPNGPAISGTRIVWTDARNTTPYNNKHNVYLYDLATGSERALTNYGQGPFPVTPDIDGDHVVWAVTAAEGYRVYAYHLATDTVQQVSPHGGSSPWWTHPRISGTRIVWASDWDGQWDIYLYDLATGTEQRLTSDAAVQHSPAIDGDRVYWVDQRHGNGDIYMRDLATGTEAPVAVHPSYQGAPAADGGHVAWEDYRNAAPEDFVNSDLYQRSFAAPTLFAPWPQPVVTPVSALLAQAVKAVHPAGGALQLSVASLPSGAKFLPLGDVTQDAAVAALDATWLGQYLGGTRTFNAEQRALADVNRDGAVTAADLTLLNAVLGGSAPALNTSLLLWTPATAQGGRDYAMSITAQAAEVGPETKPLTVSVEGVNLLTNPGFEQGKTDWTGWGTSKQLSTEAAYTGTTSAKFILDGVVGVRTVEHDTLTNLPAGAKYQVRAAIKTVGLIGTGNLQVQVEWRSHQGVLGTTAFGHSYGTTTGGWLRHSSGVITPPAGTTRARVILMGTGTGTGYFDEVRLERAY